MTGLPTPRRRGPRAVPTHFAELPLPQRAAAVTELGLPAFRADQVSRHYFTHYLADPSQMTDLSAAQRETLSPLLPKLITQRQCLVTDDGMTRKYLWEMGDGSLVESVLMRYPKRTTLCISSQVGCGMGCPFCATGGLGLTRNLTAGEMLEQVREAAAAAQDDAWPGGQNGEGHLTNVVFMGMGEPLANFKSLQTTLERIIAPAPEGFGISPRNLTVSTVGLAPRITKLAELDLGVTLAVSLHAPDDELRNELVPMNLRYPLPEVLDAAWGFFQKTGRRVSIEYALMRDVNDQAWRAQMLADKLNAYGHGWVHVNPIPLNSIPGSKYDASRPEVMNKFVETLVNSGIATSMRDTRGSKIDGACGQLAAGITKEDARK